jgi:hypothetical protein
MRVLPGMQSMFGVAVKFNQRGRYDPVRIADAGERFEHLRVQRN